MIERACCLLALGLIIATTAAVAQTDGQTDSDQPAADAVGVPQDALLIRLAEVTGTFVAQHRTHFGIIQAQLEPEASAYYEVPVESGACYSFVAVGDVGLTDVDLHVFASGVEVASHTGVDDTPVVHWCNEFAERLSVEVRAYSGRGRFAFQVLTHQAPPPGIEGRLWAALSALGGRFAQGHQPALAPQMDVLPTGGEARFELTLVGGRSYVIVAAGVPTVRDLDLVLFDPRSRVELDEDLTPSAEPMLRYRVPERGGGNYALRVIMADGFGEYGFAVYAD